MAGAQARHSGALVISLDFELAWGVRGKASRSYAANLHGARLVIPRLLAIFEEFGIAATWATVGFLFARTREELRSFGPLPEKRPVYTDPELDPYRDPIGESEEDDPLHFAPSLIEHIRRSPLQEIATHTFSHYYCTEPGQTPATFRADLESARRIAERNGIELSSIVFPRNQRNAEYESILLELGITAYRGTPRTWMWRFARPEDGAAPSRRAGRLFDSYLNLSGHGTYPWSGVLQGSGLSDVRASAFLRATSPGARRQRSLLLRRIRRSLETAARRGEIYHLWWHPHNFGRHVEENLSVLRAILEDFARLREEYAMASLTMRDVDRLVRRGPSTAHVSTPARRPIF